MPPATRGPRNPDRLLRIIQGLRLDHVRAAFAEAVDLRPVIALRLGAGAVTLDRAPPWGTCCLARDFAREHSPGECAPLGRPHPRPIPPPLRLAPPGAARLMLA